MQTHQTRDPQSQLKANQKESEQNSENESKFSAPLQRIGNEGASLPPPDEKNTRSARGAWQNAPHLQDERNKQEERRSAMRSGNGLPAQLKAGIESLSGYDMNDVNVHYNSSQPAQFKAHAYAQGTDIHLAAGQEKHLAHEAWHVVQQKQGRVNANRQLKENGASINDDPALEREADVMGAKAEKQPFNPQLPKQLKKGSINHASLQKRAVETETKPIPNELLEPDELMERKGQQTQKGNKTSKEKTDPIQEKVEFVKELVEKAIDKCEDTEQLHQILQTYKEKYDLIFAELVDLGTPKARVRIRVNPIFEISLKSGQLFYKMIGTGKPKPITFVQWLTEQLKVGNQSSKVGQKMVAKFLAPDHEPGSKSSSDKDQNPMMGKLANSGKTKIPNDQKYIKGHL